MLTPRERDIARLVSNGACNKNIARELNISERTVKAHLTTIFQKLGIADRLHLALYVSGNAEARQESPR
jgi:DNA-binding NarL/FixJ family response regulator